MYKLLYRFAASRSAADAAKVVAYANKHSKALCMLSNKEHILLLEAKEAKEAKAQVKV